MLDLHAYAVLFGARGAGKTSLVRAVGGMNPTLGEELDRTAPGYA